MSAGSEPPVTKSPANAADCHFHIYDPRFPFASNAILKPGPATVADYRLLQKRLGTSRCVIVQPSSYGRDNRCLVDALKQFGLTNARGIAVVDTTIPDKDLQDLHAAGVRGVRFNLLQAGATTLDMLQPLSLRVARMGWHIQVNMSSGQIVGSQGLLQTLPCDIVFDHFAHTIPGGRNDPAFSVVAKVLQSNKGWLKLSGAYMDSKSAEHHYSDSVAVAKAYIETAPDRLVWGSDWPHPTTQQKPDDAELFDLLSQWAPDESTRSKILVDNPAKLYGFR